MFGHFVLFDLFQFYFELQYDAGIGNNVDILFCGIVFYNCYPVIVVDLICLPAVRGRTFVRSSALITVSNHP
jgi:hypothetical protein